MFVSFTYAYCRYLSDIPEGTVALLNLYELSTERPGLC
jgi:hypothetical protein